MREDMYAAQDENALTLELKPSERDSEHGKYPSIAINNDRRLVEVYQQSWYGSTMMCRIGKIARGRVQLNGHRPVQQTVSGNNPRIAINDEGTIVEVHGSPLTTWRYSWYRVGKLSMDGESIDWNQGQHESERKITSGFASWPRVALNATNVVVAYQSAYGGTYLSFYRVGTVSIDDHEKKINWTMGMPVNGMPLFEEKRVTELSLSMNNNGYIVAVASRKPAARRCLIVRTGKLESGQITWKTMPQEDPHMTGDTPSVCINDDQLVLVVYQSTLRSLYCRYGKLCTETGNITWNPKERYNYGAHPSVAMTNGGTMVEAHETNVAYRARGHTLFHHKGTLKMDN